MKRPCAPVFGSRIGVTIGVALLVCKMSLSQPMRCVLERLGRAGHHRPQQQNNNDMCHPTLHGRGLYRRTRDYLAARAADLIISLRVG